MSYSFVKVDVYYPEYLRYFYSKYPQAASWSYEKQLAQFYDDAFGLSNFFSKNLRTLGVNAHEIIQNAGLLQDAWRKENGVQAGGWELVISQLKRLKPDVLFLNTGRNTPKETMNYIRERVPSIRCLMGNCSSPYSDKHLLQLGAYDFVITCSAGTKVELRNKGIKAFHISHAFEHTLLPKLADNNGQEESDVLISGSLNFGDSYHNIRRDTIISILKQDINVSLRTATNESSALRHYARCGAYAVASTMKTFGLLNAAKAIPLISNATLWDSTPKRYVYPEIIKKNARPPLFGIEMLRAMKKARIAFNSHIDIAGNFAANMRLFEATGVGTCLVTDWKKNLPDLFAPDKEVVAYEGVEDCIEKIRWLIDHPAERTEIAKAGHARTLSEHTWEKRIPELDSIIRKHL